MVTQTQTTTDATFAVISPADGRVLAHVPALSADEVAMMAAQLRGAQPEWEALGPAGRCRHLLDWLDWIMDNERNLVELLQAETGKSAGDAALEPGVASEVINYVSKHAHRWLADQSVRPHGIPHVTKRLRLFAKPFELVGVVLPWNMPLGMPLLDIPFALAAGASVLTKPSEATPLAWSEVVRGWREDIAAPPVLDCATGLGHTGRAVVDVVDMVQFTGSTRTGRDVAIRAAERLIPCSLELGGKDAMVVLDDADIDRAVGGAVWGGMFNAGQACVSVERVYVHEKVYDEFVAKLTASVGALRQGTDTDGTYRNDIGALATSAQTDTVERHVEEARARGASIATGGDRSPSGNYFAPTVLLDVDHSMACMREETFGPTLPVMRVSSETEAIRLANDSTYGLSASVWTRDAQRAARVARQLHVGGVAANNVMTCVSQLSLPSGGWKASGLGTRSGGPHAVRKYCREQAYVAERVHLKKEINWYPYTPHKVKLMGRVLRLLGMHDWRRRLGRKPSVPTRAEPRTTTTRH